VHDYLGPYIDRPRTTGHGEYSVTQHSAAHFFMKSAGWELLFHDERVQRLRGDTKWRGWRVLWEQYAVMYTELWKRAGCKADVITASAAEMSRKLFLMKETTNSPWVHIMLVHVPEFVCKLGNLARFERIHSSMPKGARSLTRIIQTCLHYTRFATTAIEGSHRRVKRWYGRSMQGTVSRRTNVSGLDSVLLKDLVVCRAQQWFRLNIMQGRQSNLRKVDWQAMVDRLPAQDDTTLQAVADLSQQSRALDSDEEEEDEDLGGTLLAQMDPEEAAKYTVYNDLTAIEDLLELENIE
jgi:hypothetical protein